MRRDFKLHRKWAITSLAFAFVPLVQRFILFALILIAISARMVFDAIAYKVPFWHSSWGSASSTLLGPPVGPCVLSFYGYGVVENRLFSLSAWAGLLLVTLFSYTFVWLDLQQISSSFTEFCFTDALHCELGPYIFNALPWARHCHVSELAALGENSHPCFVRNVKAFIIFAVVAVCVPVIIVTNAFVTAAMLASFSLSGLVPGLLVAILAYALRVAFDALNEKFWTFF